MYEAQLMRMESRKEEVSGGRETEEFQVEYKGGAGGGGEGNFKQSRMKISR